MDLIEAYQERRDGVVRLSAWVGGISLLLASAARLPTWEIGSPVDWLVGMVNVGFVSVFGEVVIWALFAHLCLTLDDIRQLRQVVVKSSDGEESARPDTRLVEPPHGVGQRRHRPLRVAHWAMSFWLFAVPPLAYCVVLASYFDLVRPTNADSLEWRYTSRWGQIADHLIGLGGWSGYRPLAPSIQTNLRTRGESETHEPAELLRLKSLSAQMPWIYPPLQTWLYLIGLAAMLRTAWTTWVDWYREP